MKIFISWAKEKSKLTAEALSQWLPQVIQAVEPWVSTNIEKGKRWNSEINDNLEKTKFGIICLNKDNLNEPWILFEAGALAKTRDAQVWTFLLDISYTDVEEPLSQFQHTKYEKEDIRKLIGDINNSLEKSGGKSLKKDLLDIMFDKFWPDLDKKLTEIKKTKPSSAIQMRPDREILDEILENVRKINYPPSAVYGIGGYGIGHATMVPISSSALGTAVYFDNLFNECYEKLKEIITNKKIDIESIEADPNSNTIYIYGIVHLTKHGLISLPIEHKCLIN